MKTARRTILPIALCLLLLLSLFGGCAKTPDPESSTADPSAAADSSAEVTDSEDDSGTGTPDASEPDSPGADSTADSVPATESSGGNAPASSETRTESSGGSNVKESP